MIQVKKLSYLLLATFMVLANTAFAQLDLFNKKEDLKDLNYKKLMVVIENNSLIDLALKEAVEKKWELCKAEFCSLEDFEKLKGDTSYYFLVRVKGIFKKEREPGIEFLSLLKGGPAGVKGIDGMADILSLPFCSVDDSQAYILPYVDSYVKIMQAHVLRVQKRKIAAHIGLSWYANRLNEIGEKVVLINEEELSGNLALQEAKGMMKTGVSIVAPDEIEDALSADAAKTLVTLCIAPEVEQQGSFCYKMLISADTHELFYYKKTKINAKSPKGFTKEDIKAIVFPFK